MNKIRFSTLDAFKALFAFFVVILHSPGFMGKEFLYPITRMAVPFFFIVSGYFCYNNSIEKLSNRIKRIFILLVLSELLFGILAIFVNRNNLTEYLTGIFNVKFILRVLILNEQFFYVHLWYLQAYLYALVILWVLKFFKIEYTKKYIFVAVVILIYCLTMAEFLYNDGNFNPCMYRNWLLGLAFILIGMSIHNFQSVVVRYRKIYIILSLVSIIVSYSEALLLNNFKQELYIGIVCAVITIFCFGISYPEFLKNSFVEKIGCKYSLYIYIIHPIVGHIVNVICMKLNISELVNYAMPIVVYTLSIAAAYFYLMVKEYFYRRVSVK